MNTKKNLITPEKAASFIPIFISAGISILLIVFFVLPKYFQSTKVYLELNGLIKKKNDLDSLKLKYKKINQKFDKLSKEKEDIIELISGSSNLDTLIAKIGEIGKKNNIEFVSITPKKISRFLGNESVKLDKNLNKKNQKVDLLLDPLLVEGTKTYSIDFNLKADFVNLLSFLRELEFQENVITLNDISMNLINKKVNQEVSDKTGGILDIKLSMTFYGKD